MAAQRPQFAAVLTPHRSLTREGFIAVMALIAGVNLIGGAVFFIAGAWPVAGFMGLDVLLIWWAFRANFADGRRAERIEVWPGVGRKTASVVLKSCFGEPTIAVDTHVFRVSNRTGLAPGKTPLAVELALEKAVPKRFARHAHHWLILHGRYLCKAPQPLCYKCPIRDICRFKPKTPAPA